MCMCVYAYLSIYYIYVYKICVYVSLCVYMCVSVCVCVNACMRYYLIFVFQQLNAYVSNLHKCVCFITLIIRDLLQM